MTTSTVPTAVPRRAIDDLARVIDAMATGDHGAIRLQRELLVRKLVRMMAVADIAGRLRLIRQLRSKQFAQGDHVEDIILRVEWGKGMPEAIEDLVKREPILAADADEVAHLYLTRPDAFSVAGESVEKILREMKGALSYALASGHSADEFKRQFMDRYAKPRLETIFRTNAATAYAAGRMQAAQDVDELAGWQRVTTLDSATRPNHSAARGYVYSKKDSRLGWFLLPWGYNCRCTDVPISTRVAKSRYGLTINGNMLEPETWPANAEPDPGFERSGVASIYGLN